MTTATRRRKKIARAAPALGKDSWQILNAKGEILRDLPYGESCTLATAFTVIQHVEPKGTKVELTVRLKALFGEPDDLFRVVREEDGSVNSHRL
jgi:hypothetical protein